MSVTLLENNTVESDVTIDLSKQNEPIQDYLLRLAQALRSEQEAIREYTSILKTAGLPQEVRIILDEILNDEKDHMVLISQLVDSETRKTFPNNGEKISQEPGGNDNEIDGAFKEKVQENLTISRVAFDGIQNTIKYEVTEDVVYDENDLLKASFELEDSILRFNKNNEDQISLLSLGGNEVHLSIKTSSDEELSEEKTTSILNEIFNELEFIQIAN